MSRRLLILFLNLVVSTAMATSTYVLYEGPRNRIWAARESNQHIVVLKSELRTTDTVKARAELIQLLRGLVVSP